MENALGLTQEVTSQLYDNGSLVGDFDAHLSGVDDLQLGYNDFYPYYQTYHYWYPYTTIVAPSKTDTAFKVVKILIDKKLAKIQTVKQLVSLMDELVKVL